MHQRISKAIRAIAIAAMLAAGSTSAFAQKAPAEPRSATRPAAAALKVPSKQARTAPTPTTQPAISTGNAYTALPAVPSTVADLKAIEGRVEEITKKVMPAVVGVIAGRGQGSGVIISADGYVLTAAHVAGESGRDLTLILADGRRVRAKSLGLNEEMDSGLIKISEEKTVWPHVELSKSSALVKGQWVIALGHPGGYRRDRPPVLRLGRILFAGASNRFINTDCTLMGGDSGGPLFDLSGNVVGIHSRIGASTLSNMHVPSDTYIETWERLVKGETWGAKFPFLTATGPYLGIGGDATKDDGGALIESVMPNGPAAKAGIKPGDIVISFDGNKVKSYEELAKAISRKKVGDDVAVQVLRDGRKVELSATLTRRPQRD